MYITFIILEILEYILQKKNYNKHFLKMANQDNQNLSLGMNYFLSCSIKLYYAFFNVFNFYFKKSI